MPYKDTRQSSDFAVCHRELTAAKLIFAVCQQFGTRQKIILPCVFSPHSAKAQFAVCLIFAVSFFCLALGIYCACRVPVMLLTAKSQAHGKLRVCRSARVLFLTLLGTIMYRMISIASFNQTYRLIHSYATFFLLAYTLGNMHVPFFFQNDYTCTFVHLCGVMP